MVVRWALNQADLALVTSPQLKEEMEAWGVKNVGVWRKGIDIDVSTRSMQGEGGMRENRSYGSS
jgi:hypothetical protein